MSYTKTDWQNLPNTTTPINATNLNKIENGIADASGAIGVDEYSSSSTYAVGDLCIYNNILYQCNTAISTAEAWNANHWTQTSIVLSTMKYYTDTYSNYNMKNGSIVFQKVGRVVNFYADGDIVNLPTGSHTYISSIDSKYAPKHNLQFRVENSPSAEYILLCIFPNGLVTLENYRGSAITTATNGNFYATYIV